MKKRMAIAVVVTAIVAGGIWSRSNAIYSTGNNNTIGLKEPVKSETSASRTPEVTPRSQSKPSKNTEMPAKSATALAGMLANDLPAMTTNKNKKGIAIVNNMSSLFVLVNKVRELPSTYAPKDLVIPDVPFSFSGDSPKKKMRKAAAEALESLFDAAKKDGIKLKAVSGYRSYATQKALFASNAAKKGEEVANRTSARPGQSEHQTGLAMDVSSASVGYALEQSFATTKEGKWLAAHAADHGFIIRFLKGKESVTGYSYEPWHIRYVGKDIAKDIMKKKVTLEEYLDAAAKMLATKS
ncbi:M15 family metallopeptidase [Cohnella soli]|uniref:D-alanyl-D-alanine carboxypeptidase family protein n=1 Tax=Cohnella soli TaxID=425005 RepID=A0ABW0I2A7_9BACL